MEILGVLLRQRLRRDRYQLAIWIPGIGLLGLFSASAVATTFGDAAGRASILRLAIANPGLLMLRGLPQGYGLGPFVFFQIFAFLALLAGLMSTFLAVRHTRAEEESLRAELVFATLAGRTKPNVATLVEGVLANLLVGVAVAGGFMAGGLGVSGAVAGGAATAAVGVSFVGVGMLIAQSTSTSRGANGIAAAAVVLAYLVRGLGDALGTPSPDGVHMSAAWPSWFSPIGWAQQVQAFNANSYAPLGLNLTLAAVCAAAVFALASRRDSGASIVPGRAGRPEAPARLSGTFGLAWRLQWLSILGWCVGGLATGWLAGALGNLAQQAAGSNTTVTSALQSMVAARNLSLAELLISAMFAIIGVLAAACATQTVMRLRQEEIVGSAEVILATPVSRVRWLLDYLVLGTIATVLVLLSGALASSVGAAVSGTDLQAVGDSFSAAAAQLPAALIYLAVLALLYVLLPDIAVAAGWSLLGAGVFLGIFGALVGLPQWMRNISPFTHTPVAVAGTTDWSGGVWMLGIAAVALVVAVAGMRRRSLRPS